MEKLLYFAYGSNMDEEWMKKRSSSVKFFNKAILNDYKFLLDNSGVATVKPLKGSYVEGIIWEIDKCDLKLLDKYEGLGYGFYKRKIVDVKIANNFFKVIIYISLERTDCKPPYENYIISIIKSAKFWKFSEDYIKELSDWL